MVDDKHQSDDHEIGEHVSRAEGEKQKPLDNAQTLQGFADLVMAHHDTTSEGQSPTEEGGEQPLCTAETLEGCANLVKAHMDAAIDKAQGFNKTGNGPIPAHEVRRCTRTVSFSLKLIVVIVLVMAVAAGALWRGSFWLNLVVKKPTKPQSRAAMQRQSRRTAPQLWPRVCMIRQECPPHRCATGRSGTRSCIRGVHRLRPRPGG